MSNDFEREPLPSQSDYNSEFVADYLRRSTTSDPHDGPIPDADATFPGLLASAIGAWAPPVYRTDLTIRTGTPWHGAYLSLILRHAIQFTLLISLCWLMYSLDKGLTWKICAWAVGLTFLLGVILKFAQEDESLFFVRFADLRVWIAIVTLFPILIRYELSTIIVGAMFAGLLMLSLLFPGISSCQDAHGKCLRLTLTIGLVALSSLADPSAVSQPILLRLIFVVGNYAMLLPITWELQHWFAANRYTQWSEVRTYGEGATPGDCGWSHGPRTFWAHATAFISAVGCGEVLLWSLGRLHDGADARHCLLYALAGVSIVGVINWGATELMYHNRPPSLGQFFGSYYATWRSLAAWLSYQAPIAHPTLFRFGRPWTSRMARNGLVAAALAVNASVVVSLLATATSRHLDLETARTVEPSRSIPADWEPTGRHSEPPVQEFSPTERRMAIIRAVEWNRALELEFFLPTLAIAVLLPGVVVFLCFHAGWGPTLQAYTERFESFREGVIPPIVRWTSLGPPPSNNSQGASNDGQ